MSINFTAIVINYNGADFLINAVASLADTGLAFEKIIVVDNGSTDNSISSLEIEYPDVVIINIGCNAGFAVAVNKGLKLVTTEFALLFNNDALIDKKALVEFENVFGLKPQAAILGAKLLHTNNTLQHSIAPFPSIAQELVKSTKYKSIDLNVVTRVDSVIGACLAIRMSALEKIGSLDEDFFFFLEETELCWRANHMGYEVYYVPNAVATHIQGGTASKFKSLARIEFHRSKLIYYKKTGGWVLWFVASMVLLIKSLVNFLSNLIVFLLSLGMSQSYKSKTVDYFKILLWHFLFRPKDWGLPNKCLK